MEEKTSRITPEHTIVTTAVEWRHHDQVAISDKRDSEKQRAEYRARQKLRAAIDETGGHS